MEPQRDALDELKLVVLVEDTAPFDSKLLAQHGISFYVEARYREHVRRLIVDVGQDPATLEHNMTLLGIDASNIDGVVLTHCHYDHTSGVASLLARCCKKDIPVIAHPQLFRPNFTASPALKYLGMRTSDSPENLSAAGGSLILSSDPLQVLPGLCTTGEVPRVTPFEAEPGPFLTLVDGRLAEDKMMDDMALVANVKGRGIVVVTGCSHSGIVNIVKRAMEIYPGFKLEAIVGGFHLIKASNEQIRLTAESLRAYEPAWVCAGHCTGFKAQVALQLALGERFSLLHSGSSFALSQAA
ncbi:MAG: MBL fold metallo-hydrolase [Bacillota bacterium]